MDKKLLAAALPLVFCGCFLHLAPRAPNQGGLAIANDLAGEPGLALDHDPETGRTYFAWASLRGAPGPQFTLAAADALGRKEELWRNSGDPGSGAVQFEPELCVSSSSLYAKWIERSSGTLSVVAAVYDLKASRVSRLFLVTGLQSRVREQGGIIPSGNDSAFISWEDFDPALRTPFAGVAEVGPPGLLWKKLLGDRSPGEEYLSPAAAADGAGGVFVASRHIHNGDQGIVVNHYSPDGTAWDEDAQANHFLGYQSGPVVAPDGAGGTFLLWEDGHGGDMDIYGQKLSTAGAALWDASGVPLVVADGNQWNPVLTADGKGGFFCAWIDDNMGARWRLSIQRVDAAGRPQWGETGLLVSPSEIRQADPSMVPDGAGGVILTWNEPRYGYMDVFAQRLGPDGSRLWGDDGVLVGSGGMDQVSPVLARDGRGGALVAWKMRDSHDKWGIRAQRLDRNGALLWGNAAPPPLEPSYK